MAGLVLEGGSFRTAFTLGALDALLKNEIYFPYIIGVSAGACAATSYMSRQYYRGIDTFLKYRNTKEYQSIKNYLKDGSLFGIRYIYEEIPNKLYPFDYDAFKKYPGTLKVVVTDAYSGKAEYLEARNFDYHNEEFIATCSLPGIFPGVHLNKTVYFDGGIADSIPLAKAIADGNTKNLVILTRPKGFIRKPDTKSKTMARLIKRKYPVLSKAMENRHLMYNKELDLLYEKIAANEAIALFPNKAYSDIEPDDDKLLEAYHDGFEEAIKHLEEIRGLFRKDL